ncbi:MAG: hypothetical protein M3081_00055 [Gemmatimonadota bacterium]|nr:hypothetical protein [Gemmatimonadota bacterium]
MSISSITNTYTPGIRPSAPRVDTGVARPATTNVPQAQPALPQGPKTGAAAGVNALPVEAPKGTDPELWSVLSQSERQFFARAGAMGPLTYGRIMTANHAPPPPVARGGRLDVKV